RLRAALSLIHLPFFLSSPPRTPPSTLFPYTTLFRSTGADRLREHRAHHLLFSRREHVDDAVDGLRRRRGVQGAEHQVAGLGAGRSEEHTSELQSRFDLVCRLLLEKKNKEHILQLVAR